MAGTILTGWRPGLAGEIVRAHAIYYAREWNFPAYFEAKLARELGDFLARLAPRDALLSAWDGETFLGSLAIDGSDAALAPGQAHLRWFITTDAARGRGIGGKLLAAGMAFLRQHDFASCYLTTFAGLDTARRLYEAQGFTLTDEQTAESWGTQVREQLFTWRR
jgi:ribosomal protein S18 acetylase RimI-like enzyme